ncbi:Flp pilus assembly protein CpaB [Sanguibacter gelidistatuariae]|uniref:Flp pilus assembly protein CpaB n=1 Tax=Sanguibacter gelidistatuariae TaxID=1814289 RepID=A0A1G6Q5U5_9MICO|nr:SAF domain-containing protein [Sanguibacter gelidistatuariae]SDC86985.1 Flp pilus assembly protein CpaB [Sanguibacter gelidistatuariae]
MTDRPAHPARPSPRAASLHGPSVRARRRLRGLVWKARFLLSAGALGLAAAITVGRLQPPPPVLETIVVADRAVLAGESLTADDVRTTQVPPRSRPADALRDPAEAVGRILAIPVSEGTVLSAPVLVAPRGGPQGPPGTVVAAVRLGEPALARIVGPGMHVDLLAPSQNDDPTSDDAAAATYLARRALVLPGPLAAASDAGNGLSQGTSSGDEAADLILVAVTPEEATFLANVAGRGAITAVVVQ